MRRRAREIARKFKSDWKSYLLQSALATAAIFIIFHVLSMQQVVIIASLGATAFLTFALPTAYTAQPRNVIGGHLIGVLCGSAFAWLDTVVNLHDPVIYSLAVGVSIFLMVATDTEHAPAAGTALGIAVAGFSLKVAGAVIVGAVLLSAIQHLLKPYLKDLA